MKDKIIKKATDMFLKLGFKSVTMDDIACEMCISKKTIYKYFSNKETLIEEGTEVSGNINYEVVTTGEYELLDFVPCRLKGEVNDASCMFLATTVLGIDQEEIN